MESGRDNYDDLIGSKLDPKTFFAYKTGNQGEISGGPTEYHVSIFSGYVQTFPFPLSKLARSIGFQKTISGEDFDEIAMKLVMGNGGDVFEDMRYTLDRKRDMVVSPPAGFSDETQIFPANIRDITTLIESYEKYRDEKEKGNEMNEKRE